MKKNYLLILITLLANQVFAQLNCDNAYEITLNNQYSVNFATNSQIALPICAPNGNVPNSPKASWYKFIPTENQTIRITTDLPANTNGDTRFHMYTGDCSNLICFNGDDDGGSVYGQYLSLLNVDVTANTAYYIAFDNRWSSSNFIFEISEGYIPPPPVEIVNFTNQFITVSGLINKGVVDLNGDYLDDIIGVSSNSLNIHYQNTDGTFTDTNIPVTGLQYLPNWSITAGDLDSNGMNDLLFGASNGVSFLKANDTGSAYTVALNKNGIFSQRSNFIDINNDGILDAFVCHDVAPNVYFINNESGSLTYFQGGLGDVAGGGNYGSIWVDYDNDGDMDLFIAKCRGGNVTLSKDELFRNDGNGVFTNVSDVANMAEESQAWSSAWGDFDNDGYMDALIGANSFSSGGHKLRKNNGDGTFTDITAGSGWDIFSGSGREYIAHDFNNDGWIDVMCSGGRIMINNGDLTFSLSSYSGEEGPIGDLNNDGFLDILNSNKILLNVPNENNWLKLNLQGVDSNRNGIGARVEIYGEFGKQIRDVRSGDGFAFMSSLNVHFGIGEYEEITSVVVKWPSGNIDTILNPDINSTLFVLEKSTLSIEESKNDLFSIYPNPVADELKLTMKDNTSYYTEIFDLQGKSVYQNSNFNTSINVSNLAPGMYIILLRDETGNNYSNKFIKK